MGAPHPDRTERRADVPSQKAAAGAARRRTGRILSLGFPLPGVQVDNYTFLSAPAFFDYDAIVIDPLALSRSIEGVLDGSMVGATFTGQPVRERPQSVGDVALGDLLLRRRDEMQLLLDNDGIVVCFAHPAATHQIAGAAIGDYDWLPLPDAFALRPPLLVPGEGSQVHVIDHGHPLAPFVLSQLANVAYRAHVDAQRIEGACIFARSYGDAVVGVELPLAHGRLVLAPALKAIPAGDARYAMSDALQAGIRRALGVMAPGREPSWVSKHDLPGLAERARAVENAAHASAEAQAALDNARASHEELARYRRLLWQEGELGLEGVVSEALRLLGFQVYPSKRDELEVRADGVNVLFEVEGSDGPIDMAPHYRLRQRIEQAIERRSAIPRGVLFVNGERLLPPAERRHVSDALRLAAETMRYCIAPTVGLYDAVVAHLRGDAEAVAEYRKRLLATDGFLD